MSVMEIIAGITGFMQFFVPGYVFMSCYDFASCSKREEHAHYLIIKSIAISFVFSLIVRLISTYVTLSDELLLVLDLLTAAVLGLIFGRLHRSKWVKAVANFLFKRGFANSEFAELWETALAEKHQAVCLLLSLKSDDNTYEGQLDTVISVNTNPKIFLTNYICTAPDGTVLCDYSNDPDYKMVIRYDDIKKFEFRYVPMAVEEAVIEFD
ncbi:MAG: hypothetical protein E7456_06690 [Ruminococcaceae bacterium]|nr:hypothetical protein [Oscillospiraceae bacterium]